MERIRSKMLLEFLVLILAVDMVAVSSGETKGGKREVKRLVKEQNSVLLSILEELRQENLRQNKLEKVLDAILTCHSCSHDAQCTRAGVGMKCACSTAFIGDGTRCIVDPFAPDPDFQRPGLPPFRNSWYFLSNVKASWRDARKICRRHGGDLADFGGGGDDDGDDDENADNKIEGTDPSIDGEWRHLYGAMSATSGGAPSFYWLGAHSVGAGATAWRWANGSTPLDRYHGSWRDGKPEFGRNKCLLMQDINSFRIEDSWRDYRCTAKFKFICEIHIPPAEKLDFEGD